MSNTTLTEQQAINSSKIETEIEYCRGQQRQAEVAISRIRKWEEALTLFPAYWHATTTEIYAHFETREAFTSFRKATGLTGKWTKDVSDTVVRYLFDDGGIRVQAKVSELPPSCTIVEEEVEVPARPASIQKVRRIVCSTPSKDELASSSIPAPDEQE